MSGNKSRTGFDCNPNLASKPEEAKRSHIFVEGEDHAISVEGNYIERIFHQQGMNPVAGFEPENFIVSDRWESEQAEGAFAGRVCKLDTPRNRSLSFGIEESQVGLDSPGS